MNAYMCVDGIEIETTSALKLSLRGSFPNPLQQQQRVLNTIVHSSIALLKETSTTVS